MTLSTRDIIAVDPVTGDGEQEIKRRRAEREREEQKAWGASLARLRWIFKIVSRR